MVKNKCGKLCDSNNYRLVALTTTMSKLFESVFLFNCETFLETCLNFYFVLRGSLHKNAHLCSILTLLLLFLLFKGYFRL